MTIEKHTYLGDGLYASFDGNQICLFASNGITVTNRVYLEPEVYAALVSYVARLREESGVATR